MRHFGEFKTGLGLYPEERCESWVSDSDGNVHPLDEDKYEIRLACAMDLLRGEGVDPRKLVAVGAYGANASPARLRHFVARDISPAMLTLKGKVRGLDVVYEARTTALGHVPFALALSVGTRPDFYVNFFTQEQLERTHQLEGLGRGGTEAYALCVLPGVELERDSEMDVYVYTASGRVFNVDGWPVAAASESCDAGPDIFFPVNAESRRFREATQPHMMRLYDSLVRYDGQNFGFDAFLYEKNPDGTHARRDNGSYVFNEALKGPDGRERLDKIREWLQDTHGMENRLDLAQVDACDFGALAKPFA